MTVLAYIRSSGSYTLCTMTTFLKHTTATVILRLQGKVLLSTLLLLSYIPVVFHLLIYPILYYTVAYS